MTLPKRLFLSLEALMVESDCGELGAATTSIDENDPFISSSL